ncbi:DinB family protein [uncultured Chitinophaga sp.]|uniref:DinB family protein n=1 Tax=uncultured Chitinophaga sp. TaxID=339340 RepID=UPI0025E708CB|nr:DinB family protein [uncultured Chitinophaga sp.]
MKTQLQARLKNAKQYTLSTAEAMPERDYDFKPADAVWGFNELFHHIAYGIYWFKASLIDGTELAWEPPVLATGKKETIAYLEDAFKLLEDTLKSMPEAGEAIVGFFGTLDHITHHRGQATTYLRCRNITPPEYIF